MILVIVLSGTVITPLNVFADTYTISYELDGGTWAEGFDLSGYTSYNSGTEKYLPTEQNIVKSGYSFGGWHKKDAVNPGPFFVIGKVETGNIVLQASWTALSQTITVNHYYQSLPSAATDTGVTYPSNPGNIDTIIQVTGTTYTPSQRNPQGFSVVTTSLASITVSGDEKQNTINVYYTRMKYHLSVGAFPDSISPTGVENIEARINYSDGTYAKCSNQDVYYGSNLQITTTLFDGCTFRSGNILLKTSNQQSTSYNNPYSFTMPAEAVDYQAICTENPVTINYRSSNTAMGKVSRESENIDCVTGGPQGSMATAASGYHFVNWTDAAGNEVNTNAAYTPAKVNGLNVAATYTANFAVNPTYYTITASASPASGGTVTGGGTYVEGSSVTLKAAAKEGYTFLDWHEDGKSIGTGATIDVAVSGDRTITSHFRASSSVRVFGTTRYDTMAETVKKAFPDGCETAVLASGENWPDALSASSLAGVKDCPVILTEPGQLTQQTADLLASLKVTNVIIVGGTAAISDDMKAAVEAKSITTERIWGNDRTQTADLVARRVIDSSDADTIIICSGQNFPDALSISSYAYAKKMPILLAGSDGKLTADSLAIAENFGKAIIVGGEKAVSPDVEKQLTVMKTARYEGTDRYGTSIDVINKLFDGYAPVLAVATGTNYPDALVGAALAGKSGGTILLVDGSGTSLTDDQKTIIGNAGDVWILGGDGAVSDTMRTAIDNILK